MLKGKERRRHIRARRDMTIEHRLYKRNGKIFETNWQISKTKNMSLSGILFSSEFPYLVGDTLEVRVVVSGVLDIFNGFAKVVRIEKKNSKFIDAAIAFIDERNRIIRPKKPRLRRVKSYL